MRLSKISIKKGIIVGVSALALFGLAGATNTNKTNIHADSIPGWMQKESNEATADSTEEGYNEDGTLNEQVFKNSPRYKGYEEYIHSKQYAEGVKNAMPLQYQSKGNKKLRKNSPKRHVKRNRYRTTYNKLHKSRKTKQNKKNTARQFKLKKQLKHVQKLLKSRKARHNKNYRRYLQRQLKKIRKGLAK